MKQKQNADNEYSFADPVQVIEAVGIKAGQKVADFGSGPGYFSLPIARAVEESGKVYAFDVLPAAISALESKAKLENISNLTVARANLEKRNSTGLADNELDYVILKSILYQVKNKEAVLREAYRILKKDGKVVIMEWNNNLALGPSLSIRMSEEKLTALIDSVGFKRAGEFNAGNYHFVVVATK